MQLQRQGTDTGADRRDAPVYVMASRRNASAAQAQA